jgi:hypothetical protein
MRKYRMVEPVVIWREQPAPRDPNRPVERGTWVPPSEDPYYIAKWRLARERCAAGLVDLTPDGWESYCV